MFIPVFDMIITKFAKNLRYIIVVLVVIVVFCYDHGLEINVHPKPIMLSLIRLLDE